MHTEPDFYARALTSLDDISFRSCHGSSLSIRASLPRPLLCGQGITKPLGVVAKCAIFALRCASTSCDEAAPMATLDLLGPSSKRLVRVSQDAT
jgi:hypothetical protein